MTANEKLDSILTCLNIAFNKSVNETTITYDNGDICTIHPIWDNRLKTKSEILFETLSYSNATFLKDLDLALDYLQKLQLIRATNINNRLQYEIIWEGLFL